MCADFAALSALWGAFLLTIKFAASKVEFAKGGIDSVFCGREGVIVSTGVVARETAERLFELCETCPWVVGGGVLGGNTPKIEVVEALAFGVEDGGGE